MKKDYLIVNDLEADVNVNGTARAVELLRQGWEKAESLGTDHLRVYEMRLYEAGEKVAELIAAASDEAYAKAYKEWASSRGGIVHEVLAPIDTPESLKAATDAGAKTPQQELAARGYVVIDQAVTKGALMARYERGSPPEPPASVIDFIRRKLVESGGAGGEAQ